MNARAPGQVSESTVSVVCCCSCPAYCTLTLFLLCLCVSSTQAAAGDSFRADCGEEMVCWLHHVLRKVSSECNLPHGQANFKHFSQDCF